MRKKRLESKMPILKPFWKNYAEWGYKNRNVFPPPGVSETNKGLLARLSQF